MILDLSYLRYPLPSDITMLFESGRFEEMERLIELNLSKPECVTVPRISARPIS